MRTVFFFQSELHRLRSQFRYVFVTFTSTNAAIDDLSFFTCEQLRNFDECVKFVYAGWFFDNVSESGTLIRGLWGQQISLGAERGKRKSHVNVRSELSV